MSATPGKLFHCGRNFATVSAKFSKSNSAAPFCSLFFKRNSGSGDSGSAPRFFSNAPAPGEPFIPAYEQKQGEPIETLKARLLYQSRKRGMLENGLLLSTFASKFLNSMTEGELKDYDRLINVPSNDWDIYYWATGVKPIPKEFDTAILHKFIDHVQNSNKESRIRQPDL